MMQRSIIFLTLVNGTKCQTPGCNIMTIRQCQPILKVKNMKDQWQVYLWVLYQGPMQTLDEGPDQFQELPKLSFGHRYKGPKYDIADVNDNEIFDVPKVFVK